ncbi:hypothetical protein [Desulfoluna spongiiphila]|uniref:hypothetical protein n=1 Tax=Desulfoluna spongiiphila TaxID=419481 RepID=UPI0011137F18|nr:hypothetical protein [Desulfoluna spongiiphila]
MQAIDLKKYNESKKHGYSKNLARLEKPHIFDFAHNRDHCIIIYLYNASDFGGFDLERAMFEHQDAVVYAIAVFGAEFVLLLISIYRIAKSLDKNAAAWLIACAAFPMILYVAIIYFFILGVYNIIKIKFSKNVEPSPSSGVRSPLG